MPLYHRYYRTNEKMVICLYIDSHYAGAELLICDVQRVSVSVEPPASPVLTGPVPAFKIRHLPILRKKTLFSPFVVHFVSMHPTYCDKYFTPVSLMLTTGVKHNFLQK